MWKKCWDTFFFAQSDPLLPETRDPVLSESESERISVKVPTYSWADHMHYVERLMETEWENLESAVQP